MHFGISFVVRFKGFKGSLYANQKHCIYWAIQAPECCQNSYEYEGLHSSSILSQIRVPYIYIYTYEFPSTLRLLLSPPIPNCNMLQHISHLRIQVTGDPTNMEPHKKKSHHFFCWKIQIRLVISQAVGFSYTNSTTNSLATVHLQCPMVFVVGYLSFNYSPNGAVFWVYTRSTLGFTNGS